MPQIPSNPAAISTKPLSDGWTCVQQQGWEAPLYRRCDDGEWCSQIAVLLHLGESKSVTGGPTNPEWPMTLRSNGLRRIICVGAARNSIDWLLEQAAIA